MEGHHHIIENIQKSHDLRWLRSFCFAIKFVLHLLLVVIEVMKLSKALICKVLHKFGKELNGSHKILFKDTESHDDLGYIMQLLFSVVTLQ